MSKRLLAFLSDIEHSLAADDPSPSDGSWTNSRSINYHTGVARLNLGATLPDGSHKPLGEILLHSSTLADGSLCFKAMLSWTGSKAVLVESVFEKPDTQWRSAARKVGAVWQAGAPAVAAELVEGEIPMAVSA